MKDQKKIAGWVVLGLIAVVAGVALAVTNTITEGPIADQNMEKAQGALQSFFPDAETFEPIEIGEDSGLNFAYSAMQGGQPVGYAAMVTVQGYAGPIEVTLGVDSSGALKGVSVGGPEFKETEGLGAKSREPDFTDQFIGKRPPLTLGSDVDAISGATVTSKAVVNGVNAALEKLAGLTNLDAAQPSAGGGTARTANASVMSYNGPVLVNLTLDDGGAITAIEIGRERFVETEGYGSKVKEEDFTRQFIGKTPPLKLGADIDAVSGATGSSEAVVNAVNAAWEFANAS
ncbi:MAG: FMN-binding protein [Eubacteriales bacterium]|nr:FMN-binding protein [Eubacteriales bacterium]